MPQLIIKGIEKQVVKDLSRELIDELATVVGCPRDYFTLEMPQTVYIQDGEETSGPAIIQVNWFERGQAIQDRVAEVITKRLQAKGYSQLEIFFAVLAERRYYENGKHY